MISIVLADDHHVMRQALRSLLEEQPGFQVIGEAGDGLEVSRLVECLHPDVLVLDIVMPGMGGIEVTERVVKCSPATAVVILSMYKADGYVRRAIQAGAKAYVLKESTKEELVHAIREAVAGRRYLSCTLSERAIDSYAGQVGVSTAPHQLLSDRELRVLQMIAQGYSTRQIAEKLYISPRTVEFHRNNIMRKLGVGNLRALLIHCIRNGFLPVDSLEWSSAEKVADDGN